MPSLTRQAGERGKLGGGCWLRKADLSAIAMSANPAWLPVLRARAGGGTAARTLSRYACGLASEVGFPTWERGNGYGEWDTAVATIGQFRVNP